MSEVDFEKILRSLPDITGGDPDLTLYTILDGARSSRIYETLSVTPNVEYRSLFAGRIPPVMAGVAPYLIELEEQPGFTSWLIREGWGDSWGIFALSRATLDDLLRHFRRYLSVKDESGKVVYFRYFDPRTLRAYLPTCTTSELEYVFGPVTCFFAESEDAAELVVYHFKNSQLETRRVRPVRA